MIQPTGKKFSYLRIRIITPAPSVGHFRNDMEFEIILSNHKNRLPNSKILNWNNPINIQLRFYLSKTAILNIQKRNKQYHSKWQFHPMSPFQLIIMINIYCVQEISDKGVKHMISGSLKIVVIKF